MIDICQVKVAGVLFRQMDSIHQCALALEGMQVVCLDGVGMQTQFLACVLPLSLSLSLGQRIDGSIEETFTNDGEILKTINNAKSTNYHSNSSCQLLYGL